MTNDQLVTQWLAYLLTERRVAKNTHDAYRSDSAQLLGFLNANHLELPSLQPSDLKMFLRSIQAESVGPRSVGRKVAAFKNLFNYLHERHHYPNHAQDLVMPKIESRLPKYLTQEEITALLLAGLQDTTPLGKRNNLVIYLLYVTGMRITELAQLKLSDVREKATLLFITGKGGKQRAIPLPEASQLLLQEYIHGTHAQLLRNKPSTGNEPLFPVLYGSTIKAISRQSLWIILKKICTLAGIKKQVSPHQLRHSLATHLLKNGADLRSLQILLGHEKLATVEIYTHVEVSHIRTIYDKKHPRS